MPLKIPLKREKPPGWKAQEIVYSRFNYLRKPGGEPTFSASPLGCVVKHANIVGFVRQLAQNAPVACTAPYRKHADDPHPAEPGPLDIYVNKTCYVVVQLDGAGWQFRSDGPGLTAKNDYEDDNCDLRHVAQNGEVLPGEFPGEDGCRILFFAVTKRRNFEHQYFNYHVEFLEPDGSKTPYTIDPDVPNDGGKIPFLPDPPVPDDDEAGGSA